MDDLPNLQELKKEESIFDSLQKNALETIRELSGQLWTCLLYTSDAADEL